MARIPISPAWARRSEDLPELGLGDGVEHGADLVGDHEPGPRQQGPRHGDALEFTARQLVRVTVEPPPAIESSSSSAWSGSPALGQDPSQAPAGVDRQLGVLEDELHRRGAPGGAGRRRRSSTVPDPGRGSRPGAARAWSCHTRSGPGGRRPRPGATRMVDVPDQPGGRGAGSGRTGRRRRAGSGCLASDSGMDAPHQGVVDGTGLGAGLRRSRATGRGSGERRGSPAGGRSAAAGRRPGGRSRVRGSAAHRARV